MNRLNRSTEAMRIRHGLDGTNAVHDTTEDRDLVAMINEARDPAEIDRIAAMARHRERSRRRAAAGTATERPRRRGLLSRRALGFRH
jgi:hypothetical protein